MGKSLEDLDNGYLDIENKSAGVDTKDLVYHCIGTLPHDYSYDDLYYENIFSHALSKYSYLINCDVIKKQVDSNGIVCLTAKQGTWVELSYDKTNYKNTFELKRFDVLLFPDFIKSSYNIEFIHKTIYPIKDKTILGNGNNMYEVSLTLSDTYILKIYANSEEDAINKSYDIGLSHFDHIVDRSALKDNAKYITQISRGSIWHKGMLKAREL